MFYAPMNWVPLLQFPIEWGALGLLVVACLYWERSGFSGIGVEGCLASSVIGLMVGYQATGSYPLACLIAAGCAALFGILSGTMVQGFRADPAIGALGISLAPVCAVGLLTKMGGLDLLTASPPPEWIRGTIFDGTYAEDLLCNPWLLAAPFLIALAAWILWQTPYGLRLRAFGENPAWRVLGSRPLAYRLSALSIGALWTVPAAALLLRSHPETPPFGLGFLALACTIAGRWTLPMGLALAAGPALLRVLRPYAAGSSPLSAAALDAAPYLLALLYLIVLARRSLRLSASPQAGTDPDVL